MSRISHEGTYADNEGTIIGHTLRRRIRSRRCSRRWSRGRYSLKNTLRRLDPSRRLQQQRKTTSSSGKALSEREEAFLQALELMTRGQDSTVWIKAAMLREKVARLIGQPVEKMGDTQWLGHMLKRLHLLDEAGRKRGMDFS